MKNLKLAIKELKLRRKFKRYRLKYDASFTSLQNVQNLIAKKELDENKLEIKFRLSEDDCNDIDCKLIGGICECFETVKLKLP